MKRLIIEVEDKYHKELKARASLRGENLRKYVLRAIAQMILREKKYE